MGVTAEKIARKAIHAANAIVNIAVLVAILLFIAFSGYALWDSKQLYNAADSAQYGIYKPRVEDGETASFEELQAINPDVFSWLTVYGTHIDYPVTQGEDNSKYVNTNAYGEYSLAGAIFLDFRNHPDYRDFNSILYGHHMEKQAMFGEIGLFSGKEYFEEHPYGNLFADGKNYGLAFFAFLKTDAYDFVTFTPNIQGAQMRQRYLQSLVDMALYTRDIPVSSEDRILLLTTCASDATNGRDILVAKITDNCYEDTFETIQIEHTGGYAAVDRQNGTWESTPRWIKRSLLFLPLILLLALAFHHKKRRNPIQRSKKS